MFWGVSSCCRVGVILGVETRDGQWVPYQAAFKLSEDQPAYFSCRFFCAVCGQMCNQVIIDRPDSRSCPSIEQDLA